MSNKRLANISLGLGILGLAYPIGPLLFAAIIAIVTGFVARSKMVRDGSRDGYGRAVWGIGLGIAALVIFVLYILVVTTAHDGSR